MTTIQEQPTERIELYEQVSTPVFLSQEDAGYMESPLLRFDVIPGPSRGPGEEAGPVRDWLEEVRPYEVNPRQNVGHFVLPSKRVVRIQPKIPAANVFRMLAYVYTDFPRDVFRPETVLFERDTLFFEPLVQLFNDLVRARARRGLQQDYVAQEENLAVMRGRVRFGEHLLRNHSRPDRLFCRYHENTIDIEDNRIVLWTLRFLLRSYPWCVPTVQALRGNLHQFTGVSLEPPSTSVFDRRHYYRLNEDYRTIHGLCRMFLAQAALSEKPGEIRFKGFLLNMNTLFQDFVTQAFLNIARHTALSASEQKSDSLSSYPIEITPDVTIWRGVEPVAVVDAKYKQGESNSDFYQMLAYGTGLNCERTHLFYPSTEIGSEGVAEIRNSTVKIHVRRVNIEDPNCVELMETAARAVVTQG